MSQLNCTEPMLFLEIGLRGINSSVKYISNTTENIYKLVLCVNNVFTILQEHKTREVVLPPTLETKK